jgi:HPt (histidine-containing phosphotransfer) domain-containing protein
MTFTSDRPTVFFVGSAFEEDAVRRTFSPYNLHFEEMKTIEEAIESLLRDSCAIFFVEIPEDFTFFLETIRGLRLDRMEHSYIPVFAGSKESSNDLETSCLDAGVDRVISLPPDPEILENVLEHWGIAPRGSVFDLRLGLKITAGDRSILDQAVSIFLEDAIHKIMHFRQWLADGLFRDIEMTAHSLKGGASYIGAQRLKFLFSRLENASRLCETGRSDFLLGILARELLALREEWSPRAPRDRERY